jgi:integrase
MTAIPRLAASFQRAQRAEGKSPHTQKLYHDCIARLVPFLVRETGSDDLSGLSRRLLTDFYAYRAETCAPATVWTDWKVHKVFLRWCVDEEEIAIHPMARMKAPKQPITPVPTFSDDDLARLLTACSGRSRRDKRDLAIIRLAIDTGARRGEMAGLRMPDLDLEDGIVRLTGKGKTRLVPIGSKTVIALDRHVRASGPSDSVFGLTASGLSQAFKERAKAAGLPDAHLHMTRHTFAHRWLAASGSETDLMSLAGWAPGSRGMMDRYGASARVARAIAAHRRLSPGDRV